MQRVPSTQALRALEAFARLGTIWQAAEELNLTKSAVTHQLRQLERDLGFPISDKVGTKLALTPAGRRYALDVRKALDALNNAAARSATSGPSGVLTVSCPPGFASHWLCTVVEGFHTAFPDIHLNLTTPRRLDDVSNPEVDVFISFGREFSGGVALELLREIAYTPLCSPAYLNKLDGLATPAALARATLLHLNDYGEWSSWMRMVDLPEEWARKGIRFADMNLAYSAALAGQGIAMGDEFVCSADLLSGKLVRPFPDRLATQNAYYLAVPRDRPRNATVAAFVSWIKEALPEI
ncbi:LysR family transcriptional regulator [Epibacterium ulvae]|uniref:LysR substrate-binding domain-containing protein n=1 Tax=Epibacterium ulvae TaxID=1156985 RepID=UPI001BFC924B|nr:LysR substrate-binding domain-containing protein [Epibacterium ulvae]MBT8154233.1 LysR family transcriptional regulator [Epibacterium ulvae]